MEFGLVEAGDLKPRLARLALGMATFGVVLRLVRYLQNYPLWCDESMLAANLLDRRWGDLARPLDYHQVCPLGFLALAWTAIRGLGFSESSLRLVPQLAALASVPVFLLLARRVLGAGTVATLLAVGLFAVAQPPIRFAAEFKPYATDLLAATVLLLLTLKWREAPERRRWLFGLAIAAPVCVSVSLPSIFVLASIAIVGFVEIVARRRRRLLGAYAAFLAATGAGIAAMAALGQYQTTPAARAYFLNFWSRAFPPSWRDPAALIGWLGREHSGPLFAYPHGPASFPSWLNAAVFLCFVVGIAVRARRDPGEAALLVLPFVLTFAASVVRRYPYGMSARVAQFLVPSTLILTAAGFDCLSAQLRPALLRRWAAPGVLGLCVALGVWRLTTGLSHPYRTAGDRTTREFARWFWEELSVGAELVCVQSDLKIPFRPEPWSYDGLDLYLCYQRIYSARHRQGRPPRWDSVSTARPLRCVLLNRTPAEVPGFLAWLESHRRRYVLRDVRGYPAFRGTRDEPGQFYVVCELAAVGDDRGVKPPQSEILAIPCRFSSMAVGRCSDVKPGNCADSGANARAESSLSKTCERAGPGRDGLRMDCRQRVGMEPLTMTRDTGRRPRRSSGDTPMASLGGVRTRALAPRVEPLEERQLLSAFYTGLSTTRPVQSSAGVFTLAINGPGLERITHVGKGQIAITLLGTTAASTLNVSLTRQKLHAAVAPVQIASIKVVSGQLGGINAGAAVLNGALTPLSGSVANIQFGGLGQNAQIDVNGSLNNLALGSVALGPGGHVRIAGDLNQTLSVGGPLILDGGSFVVGHNLTGALNVGGLDLTHGGAFIVGHDLTGGATVNGNLSITHGGVLGIGHNLGGLTVVQGATIDTTGLINVGNDLAGAFTVEEGLTVAGGGVINVTRDATLDKAGNGGIAIAGDLNLAGGKIQFGRDLDIFKFSGSPSNTASLNINGNLIVGTGGSINVGGNLNRMNVGGFFKGNGTATPDLIVGLSLANLVVNGGANNQGGIQQASIEVGKSLLNLTVPHGIFNSFITAGVLIDNVNVGPDGPDAVFNSDIRAGVRIDHTTIPGNVRSTFVGNPNSTGYPTRIVAGEDRAGNYSAGGVIDHFQITGELIDSVIAASVAPSGGKGMLPVVGYGQPNAPDGAPGDLGFNTYDAPAGTTTVFLSSNPPPTVFNNFTELSYVNGKLVGVAYASSSVDPTIDDFIYPGGSINPSFAVAGVLPSESTVLGGVISTKHGDPPDSADFAGLFAADTRGVFVGVLPS